jgi:predicted dehydrogenase
MQNRTKEDTLSESINIGLIGTGFGRQVMLPAFRAIEGARITAVCSGHRENAEAVAREHGIPGVYDDYREMLEREDLDLVAIVTPPYLHYPMTLAALERGVHVLCEKPTAMNIAEACEMYERAEQAGVLHLIDHELRFHPSLRRLKELVDEGYLGRPESVSFSIHWGYPMDPQRPWGWWFDAAKGGGLLGALGSHQIDLLRWLFGEFHRVSGRLHTFVKERPLPETGERRPVTSDDYCTFTAELECGAVGTVVLDATARVPSDSERWRLAFHGEAGSLIFDGLGRLWGLKREGEPEELTPKEPVPDVPGLAEGTFPRAFVRFARLIVEALRRDENHVEDAATFYDGVKVQAVLDAVRASHERGSWVEVPE